MDPTDVPPDWLAYLGKFGVPSFVAVVLYWAAPKVWKWFNDRASIDNQTTDLTKAGLGGVTDVVSMMRTQIGDLSQQFKDVEQKLREMSQTLDQAVLDKTLAQQTASKAQSDLYTLQLYVERLRAQIQSLGATPIPQ